MINLSRKFRHKLLKDNRFRKYLMYALGEILFSCNWYFSSITNQQHKSRKGK